MMRRALLVSTLMLALAPAVAHATVLHTTMSQPNDVQDINSDVADTTNWLAQSFTPTQSGAAHLVSFFGQTTSGGGFAVATMAIYTDAAGKPGTELASGGGTIGEITTLSPTCVALNASPNLTAGTKYWAVFRGSKEVNWRFWRNAAMSGMVSNNSGATWTARAEKTFSLRVETGAACAPAISTNPVSGTGIKEMYVKPGGTSFNTLTVSNTGSKTLSLTAGGFAGGQSASFRLLQGEPNGPANQPFSFPTDIGATAEAVRILYIVCDGSQPEGQRTSTFNLGSNDTANSFLAWPVSCLVDGTPPSIQFSQTPTGRANWHITSPATLTASGIDPESGNRVIDIACTDSNGPNLHHDSGSVARFQLTAQGVHNLACQAKDVAGNTGAIGGQTTSVKIDSVAPNAVKGNGPPAIATSATAQFAWSSSDASSGVQEVECRLDGLAYGACTTPATRSGLGEGAHVFEVRTRDVAGTYDASPARWDFLVDTVAPDTSITGGPAALTTATTAAFTVTGADGAAGSGIKEVRCALDGVAPAKCPAPVTYANLGEGHHTLSAWAVDQAGHVDGQAATVAWDIDRTAPTATLTDQPAATTTQTTASFAFVADNAGAAPLQSFECSWDGADFSACTSPAALGNLAAGQEHTFAVRAIDTLGNVQAAPTAFTWTVETPPVATPTPTPSPDPTGTPSPTPSPGPTSSPSPTGTQPPATSPLTPSGGNPFVPSAPAADTVAPLVTKVALKRRRLKFTLSETSMVAVVFQRLGRGGKKVTRVVAGAPARNVLRLPRKVRRRARYRITIVAVDGAGNASKAAVLKRRV